jgi:hypothetical protein
MLLIPVTSTGWCIFLLPHSQGEGKEVVAVDQKQPTDGVPGDAQGVYGIGVASELVGTAVQNLRAYERAGLVDPSRTSGGTRLYSPDDIARLRQVQRLLADGLNLAGIARVLDLEEENSRLREEVAELRESHSTEPD